MPHSPDNIAPVLYSFRRCPYAMRARLMIYISCLKVELRDILLKDKPAAMTSASPKATVPVLVLEDGKVLDESLDIMLWAAGKNDPQSLFPDDPQFQARILNLIQENDGPFKSSLDRYKYHVRFPEKSREAHRQDGEVFLSKLEEQLQKHSFLLADAATLADLAIFPFIRQFANSDRDWFDHADYPYLQKWLNGWLSSNAYLHIMKKRPIWQPDSPSCYLPELQPVQDN